MFYRHHHPHYREPILGRVLFVIGIAAFTVNVVGAVLTYPAWISGNLSILTVWIAGLSSALILIAMGRVLDVLADIRHEASSVHHFLQSAAEPLAGPSDRRDDD